MKKCYIPFLLLFSILSISAQAQFTKIGVSLGYDTDLVKNLSANYISSASTLDVSSIDFSQLGKANVYSMACENPHVRVYTTYDLPSRNASAYFALVGIFNRWDDISYSLDDGSHVSFGSVSHEIAFESSYDKRYTLWDFLYLDLGIGANLGLGFGGHAYINSWLETNDYSSENRGLNDIFTANDIAALSETSELNEYGNNKTSVHARVFGKAGAGIIFFDRFELGASFRYGYGLRSHLGSVTTPTELVSFAANTAYRF